MLGGMAKRLGADAKIPPLLCVASARGGSMTWLRAHRGATAEASRPSWSLGQDWPSATSAAFS